MKSSQTGIKRIIKAFSYSYDGLCSALKSEAALRQDFLFFFVCCAILFCLNMPLFQKALLFFPLALILLMELVNTSIETTIDRISSEYHELSKKAKDIGSLLVLLSFMTMGVVWALVLIPYFFEK